MSQRISFILCGHGRTPVGGYKIVYEYANRLVQRGWKVAVVHPATLSGVLTPRGFLGFLRRKFLRTYLPAKWFRVDPHVRMLWVRNLSERHIPDADFIVACPVQSAGFVNSYPRTKGTKYYFIQGFEDWAMPLEDVQRTWKMPLRKIVIARWLRDKAEELGERVSYIPNAPDTFFRVNKPFPERHQRSVVFLNHASPVKGTRYAIEAIMALKRSYPNIEVSSFGACPRPIGLPGFIRYFHNPHRERLREIYNSAAVFLSPGLSEGWPLPPSEAMLCGCVVIATDIGGHREYIVDERNGLLCTSGSSDAIVEKVEKVFQNREIACDLSAMATVTFAGMDWGLNVTKLEDALTCWEHDSERDIAPAG